MSDKLQHRKAERTARITDKGGNVLANTKIRLEQTNHEFLFGSGGFDILPYAGGFGGEHRQFIEERAEKWFALYNYGTLPFYWGQFEREEGKPGTEFMKKTAGVMKERGVKVKGHPLCWHTVCADWLMQYDNETILDKQLKRIDREVGDFKGLVDMWDVINEVVIMPDFDKYDNAVTRICKEYGRIGLIKKVFERAKAANPDAELLLNDFNTSPAYQILIEGCLEAGVPISTIGIQSHQHQGYWGREKLEQVLARFEVFGLPIHFTENTLVSGSLIPPEIEDLNDWQVEEWPSTPEGEERQADEVIKMYRILFEHPLVKGITGWDFADGAWLGAPSGMIRRDNSEKPAYKRLMELIHKEWHTDSELITDENGMVKLCGFKGDYVVSCGDKTAAVKLTDNCGEITLALE